jgi:hypothetical protein
VVTWWLRVAGITARDDAARAGRTLGRITAELGLQFHQIGEDVGLAPQFVGDHRRLARNRRNDRDADAAALHRFDQRASTIWSIWAGSGLMSSGQKWKLSWCNFHKSRVSLLSSSLDASGISILSPVSSIFRLS